MSSKVIAASKDRSGSGFWQIRESEGSHWELVYFEYRGSTDGSVGRYYCTKIELLGEGQILDQHDAFMRGVAHGKAEMQKKMLEVLNG